jgi:hypothetical protein
MHVLGSTTPSYYLWFPPWGLRYNRLYADTTASFTLASRDQIKCSIRRIPIIVSATPNSNPVTKKSMASSMSVTVLDPNSWQMTGTAAWIWVANAQQSCHQRVLYVGIRHYTRPVEMCSQFSIFSFSNTKSFTVFPWNWQVLEPPIDLYKTSITFRYCTRTCCLETSLTIGSFSFSSSIPDAIARLCFLWPVQWNCSNYMVSAMYRLEHCNTNKCTCNIHSN